MEVAARPKFDRRVHADPVGRLHHGAVVAHVLDSGPRVLGDEVRGREIRCVVPARRRDRHRDRIEPVAGQQIIALEDEIVARRVHDRVGRDRVVEGVNPGLLDLVDGHAHAERIDLAVGGQAAHQHRDVELAPLAVDHVGEQECLAVFFVDAASELPAHQRVHLGVLVDLALDLDQEAGLAQRLDVLVQIGVAARGRGGCGRVFDFRCH